MAAWLPTTASSLCSSLSHARKLSPAHFTLLFCTGVRDAMNGKRGWPWDAGSYMVGTLAGPNLQHQPNHQPITSLHTDGLHGPTCLTVITASQQGQGGEGLE